MRDGSHDGWWPVDPSVSRSTAESRDADVIVLVFLGVTNVDIYRARTDPDGMKAPDPSSANLV